jgi:type III pantothenate kinase
MLLCIDIGNTHTHCGLHIDPRGRAASFIASLAPLGDIATPQLADPANGLPALLARLRAEDRAPRELVFCSVVPAATARLLACAAAAGLPAWQLTHTRALGVPISYPRPAEVGQDRLANAAGAHALIGGPAVVIDLGTAVTFDIVTHEGGYEGGIITPGPALVTRYLHERTAQLPLVEDLATPVSSVIGRSTEEAIRIGAVVGFAGLIQALLDAVLAELAARPGAAARTPPAIILSGGASAVVAGRLRQAARDEPHLALLGLAAARALAR